MFYVRLFFVSDPVPMRLRALPQSFWKQPNIPPALSPGNIFSSLPPLSGYTKDDDVAGKTSKDAAR